MYTTQRDGHGNTIVCKGSVVRKGYAIIFTGTYKECLARSVAWNEAVGKTVARVSDSGYEWMRVEFTDGTSLKVKALFDGHGFTCLDIEYEGEDK